MSTTSTNPVPAPAAPRPRLAAGGLRTLVAAHLTASPDREFTVTEVTRALNAASSGAVGNALMSLAASGAAVMSCAAPRRFHSNDATAAAASGAPVVPGSAVPASGGSGKTKTVRKATRRRKAADTSQVVPAATGVKTHTYQSRELAGMPDVQALRALREAEVPVLLYGPPGTGKTSVVQAAFPDAICFCGDGDVQVSDLVGEWTQNPDGTYAFRYGPLVQAMAEGRVLFIDEATLISPVVLAAVYSALDSRRSVTVKSHKGEVITAEPGFWVCAGRNPNVAGEHLSEALASRFSAHIAVSSDLTIAQECGVNPHAVTVAQNLAARVASGESTWSPQLRELLAFTRLEKVLGTEAAFANLVGIAPDAERDTVAQIVAAVTGKETTPLALGVRVT